MKFVLYIALFTLAFCRFSPAIAAQQHKEQKSEAHKDEQHKGAHHEGEHGHEQAAHIDKTMAQQVGIVTAEVGGQVLRQTIISYGSLTTGPEQLSHVRARYTGIIKSVLPTIGDRVRQGDLLAEVESNESLKKYQVLAPIAGTVIQRHANTGETTQDQVLFTLADFDTLWAELRIYPAQQDSVKTGQTVYVIVNNRRITGSIQHIIPELNKPYQLARVLFDNTALGLSPGMLIEGHIIIGEFHTDLAVSKSAIQTMGEQQGVFLQKGNAYTFTPLQFGRKDDHFVEVIKGAQAGQVYVSGNSYLIKADIEKSEAEHQH